MFTRARRTVVTNSLLALDALTLVQTNQAQALQPAAPPNMAAVPPPPAPPAVPFALTPALADDAVINYATSEGKKLWKEATEVLPLGEFDGKNPNNLLSDLDQRAKTQGWLNVLTVTVAGINHYLPRQYGGLTMVQVRAHADVYMTGMPDRLTQNSLALAECLYKSIDQTLRAKVNNNPALYEYVINGNRVNDGPLLLMTILSHCQIKTKSTATNVRIQLTKLDQYMRSDIMRSGDITSFNTYVRELVNQLARLNETMNESDILIHLIDGYKASPDSTFATFMATKHERIMYFEDPDNTVEAIMQLAEQFYTDRVSKGEWAKPSGDQEKIVVLESQIRNLSSSKNKKNSKDKKGKGKKGKKEGKGKSKDGKNFSYEPSQAWKWVAPAAGEPKTKKVKDAQYFWCPNHQHQQTKAWGMWSRHKLSDCKANPPSSSSSSYLHPPKSFHALNTIIEQANDDGEDADYDYN